VVISRGLELERMTRRLPSDAKPLIVKESRTISANVTPPPRRVHRYSTLPSTLIAYRVMLRARFEARKSARLATSSALTIRLNDTLWTKEARISLKLTPWGFRAVGDHPVDAVAFVDSRQNCVCTNAIGPELDGERLHKPDDRPLRRGVRSAARSRAAPPPSSLR
jgi:hypothetical protein